MDPRHPVCGDLRGCELREGMTRSALSQPNFRLFFIGNVFTLNGIWMQRMTVGWVAWEVSGSPGLVGLVSFINFVPTILFSVFFGALIDRIPLMRLSYVLQTLFLATSCLLFGTWAAGLLSPLTICSIALLLGTVNAAFNPLRMAMAPLLAMPRFLGSVVALSSVNLNIARMTGPALGGLAISALGIGGAFLAQATLFLPNLIVLALISPRCREGLAGPKRSIVEAIIEGAALARDNRAIRQALLLSGIFGFLARGVMEILPVIADGGFGKGATGLGILASSAGAGALLGGLQRVLFSHKQKSNLPPIAVTCSYLGMICVIVVGLSTHWPLSVAAVFSLGFCSSVTAVSIVTGINMSIDDHIRGRIGSIWLTTAIGAAAVGALAMGGIAEWVGLASALVASGVIGCILTAFVLLRRPQTKDPTEEHCGGASNS